MKKKLVNKVLCYGLAAAMAFGSMPVSAAEIGTTEISVDTEAVADDSEDISEDAEDESAADTSISGDSLVVDAKEEKSGEESENGSDIKMHSLEELLDYDLTAHSEEEINEYFTDAEDEDVWIYYSSLSDEMQQNVMQYYVFNHDVQYAEYELNENGETYIQKDYIEMPYIEYLKNKFGKIKATNVWKETGTSKVGYWFPDTPNNASSSQKITYMLNSTSTNPTYEKARKFGIVLAAPSDWCLSYAYFTLREGTAKTVVNPSSAAGNYTYLNVPLAFHGVKGYSYQKSSLAPGNKTYTGECKFTTDGSTGYERWNATSDFVDNIFLTINLWGESTIGQHADGGASAIYIRRMPITYTATFTGAGSATWTYGSGNNSLPAAPTAPSFSASFSDGGGNSTEARAFSGWTIRGVGGNYAAGAAFPTNFTSNVVFDPVWGNTIFTMPGAPSKKGYDFIGWRCAQNGGVYGAGAQHEVNCDVSYTAQWKAHSYTVKYVSDGNEVSSQSFTYGTAQNLKTLASLGISKPGYTFAGWNHQYKDGDSVNNLTDVNGGSVTLTTQWTANTNTPYTINRYVQKEFDNTDPATGYEIYQAPEGTENALLGTEIKAATTDSSVTEIPTAIPGYETPDAITQNISGDGSTTFNFYYNLIDNRATVTVNHYYQTVEGGDYVLYDGKFGDYAQNNYTNTFSGTVGENKEIPFLTSDSIAMDAFNKAYKDYILVPVDAAPKTVTLTKETVVNYYYNLKKKNTAVEYKVEHYIQRSEGGQYELYKTVKDWADLGSTITPALNEDAISEVNKIEGCKCDKPQLQVVTVKEGLVVKYYYACISKAAAGKDGENGKDGQNAVDITDEATINEIAKKLAAGLSFKLDLEGASYEIVQNPDGTLGIKFVTTTDTKVVIPDVIKIGDKVYRITEVHDKAFYDNTSLREVVVSKNISTIGNSAFEKCINLKTVKLNEGLVNIGDKAFRDCSALESVKMPSTVQNIGNYAFENCVKLRTVTLNNGLLKIGKKAFYNCKSLKKIKIPKSVLKIGSYAFGKCIKLASVTFAAESQLLEMGEGCFYYCRALKKISLPAKLTTVPVKCFKSDTKLTSVTIGKNVTKIRKQAFSGCKKIKKITLPSRVQTIESQAFYNCKSLKNVTIKSNALTGVGSKAFKKCKKGIQFKIPNKKTASYKKLFKGKY